MTFDESNLIGTAGLVPVMKLAKNAGLIDLGDQHVKVPTDKGANAGGKLACLVAGMVAGADSIDDMNILRHGAMGKLFSRRYAPSTLGQFLRAFTFGHVRQVDAVASRLLGNLAAHTRVLGSATDTGTVFVDIDDTIIEVHGYAKQGAGYGYTGVRGLNAAFATISSDTFAPVIGAQRLRKGAAGSSRGAARLAWDVLALGSGTHLAGRDVALRADSAYYSHSLVATCLGAGADVSITVRMDPAVKRAIATIDPEAWVGIKYPNAIFDEPSGRWISRAEVAEVAFTAFTSKKKSQHIPGRLVVRRIPELNPSGQDSPFDTWRFHAFFTTTSTGDFDTIAADKTHRQHAIIENVHADLKASALAHMPSGRFNANAVWTACAVMAFNLTRADATLTEDHRLVRATTATTRRTLINIPARVASRAQRLHLHPNWPWQNAWTTLYDAVSAASAQPVPI